MYIKEKLKKLAKRLFSITDYNETHHILYFCFFKIKFPKEEFLKKKKENKFYYYKKNNIDITTLPPATGQIRDIQLANLALLNELDHVCKCAGLAYWIDGGTLLGAVRHKGFIPWDDDIDTAMLREDYEQIIDAFKKHSRNPDIYADYTRDNKNHSIYIIKVLHKKCPHLFVDIFPWDRYGEKLSEKQQLEVTKHIKKVRKKLHCSTSFKTSNTELHKKIKELMQKTYLQKKEECDFVWGMEYNHTWKNWFTNYEVVFPLKMIEFEGRKYVCINNPDKFLSRVYGDYMNYPPKIGRGHSSYLKISNKEKRIIESLKNG